MAEGCCPLHGIPVAQVGLSGSRQGDSFVAACPRRDCGREFYTSGHGEVLIPKDDGVPF